MKHKKLLMVGVLGISLFTGVFFGSDILANEESIYIPESSIRSKIVELASHDPETDKEVVIKNELPTIKQLQAISGSVYIELDYEDRSLEGLQYLTNVKYLSLLKGIGIMDYRPLGGMSNLERLQLYKTQESEDEALQGVNSLSFVRNLKKLRVFDGGAGLPVLDLTPFSDLEFLESVRISGNLKSEMDIAVSRENKSNIIVNPVKYPENFEGDIESRAYTEGGQVSVIAEGSNFIITDIPENSKSLTLDIFSQDEIFMHHIIIEYTINWY